MEETIFPGTRAIGEPEEMEEERRLCYVAITRAKERLYLSSAHQRMLFGRTTANRVSRFVSEIPAEHLRSSIPKNYGYSERPKSSFQSGAFGVRQTPARTMPEARKPAFSAPTGVQKSAKPVFAVGDAVRHTAFGDGEILKMTPMGGDFLVEIRFEKVGTKKLMLRAAAQHMEKR